MNNLNIATVVIVVVVALYLYLKRGGGILFEGYKDKYTRELDDRLAVPTHTEQGDLFLANLYRQIHMLERVARERIAINNDGPGGDKGVPRDRPILERIARDSNNLKKAINQLIERHAVPPRLPYHYASNPMVGLPSQAGSVPWYMPGN